MKALLLHLLVTAVWTFLHGNTTLSGFFVGAIASFIMLWIFRKVLKCEDYVRRVLAALTFIGHFLIEVVRSNIKMAKLCLKPGIGNEAGAFTNYKVDDLTPTEVVLMAYLINLTPGTTVADKTEDNQFVLHSFPTIESSVLEKQITHNLKRRLLAVTR